MKYIHTISGRLTLLFVLIVTLILSISGGIGYWQAVKDKDARIENELTSVAERLNTSLPTILWNLDQVQLTKTLAAEANSGLVQYIVIADDAGKITGGVVRADGGKAIATTTMPAPSGPTRKIEIRYDNAGKLTAVGNATVGLTTALLDQALNRNLMWLLGQIVILDVVITVSLYLAIATIVIGPLDRIKEALKDIAEGEADLTKRLEESARNEFGDVAHWFNVFMARLQAVFKQLTQGAVDLASAAEEAARISERANTGALQQKQLTDSMADTVRRVTNQVSEVGKNASIGSDASAAADAEAQKSRQVIDQSIQSIHGLAAQINSASTVVQQLAEDTNRIDGVLSIIADIADQTNLLALNAAIEAARAGEQGRGFAVVADEVRQLAERTTASTKQIKEMVVKIKDGSDRAVQAMIEGKSTSNAGAQYAGQAQSVIESIVASISRISLLNAQISTAADEQTRAVCMISDDISNVVSNANQTAEVSRQTARASESLENLAEHMKGLVGQFRV